MADQLSYKTLCRENGAEFVIHKSRFIGYGCPCAREEDALAFLARIRQRHKDATHNCYAYIIGLNAGIMRYSDDGEPSGTAGLPIIEVMKARGVVNCAVVVTRYFGGVLLGAGGLVRAYAQGSKTALEAAGVVVMRKSARWLIEVDYSTWQRLEYFLRAAPCMVLNTEFGVSVVCTLMVRCEEEDSLLAEITRVCDGRVETLPDGTLYYPWPEEVQAI
ncbi:MAG TPA: YigZ family protein [Candidatus Ventricola intestinavium]|nr:YigZ family protein [Candidatus Ventricola intestinavium]